MSPMHEPGVYKTPEHNCFECGASLNAIAEPGGSQPSPGDATMCLHCGAIYGIDESLRIRELTMRERAELAGDHDAMREFRMMHRGAHFARRTQAAMVN